MRCGDRAEDSEINNILVDAPCTIKEDDRVDLHLLVTNGRHGLDGPAWQSSTSSPLGPWHDEAGSEQDLCNCHPGSSNGSCSQPGVLEGHEVAMCTEKSPGFGMLARGDGHGGHDIELAAPADKKKQLLEAKTMDRNFAKDAPQRSRGARRRLEASTAESRGRGSKSQRRLSHPLHQARHLPT